MATNASAYAGNLIRLLVNKIAIACDQTKRASSILLPFFSTSKADPAKIPGKNLPNVGLTPMLLSLIMHIVDQPRVQYSARKTDD